MNKKKRLSNVFCVYKMNQSQCPDVMVSSWTKMFRSETNVDAVTNVTNKRITSVINSRLSVMVENQPFRIQKLSHETLSFLQFLLAFSYSFCRLFHVFCGGIFNIFEVVNYLCRPSKLNENCHVSRVSSFSSFMSSFPFVCFVSLFSSSLSS